MVQDPLNSSSTSSTEASQSASSTVSTDQIKSTDYENNLKGLCEYLAKMGYVQGGQTKMAAEYIGATEGYKYNFNYESGAVTVELYSYDLDKLNDTAKQTIDSVKTNGTFQIGQLDPVKAQLSNNGKYLFVYSDTNLSETTPNEKNKQRQADFTEAVTKFYE